MFYQSRILMAPSWPTVPTKQNFSTVSQKTPSSYTALSKMSVRTSGPSLSRTPSIVPTTLPSRSSPLSAWNLSTSRPCKKHWMASQSTVKSGLTPTATRQAMRPAHTTGCHWYKNPTKRATGARESRKRSRRCFRRWAKQAWWMTAWRWGTDRSDECTILVSQ